MCRETSDRRVKVVRVVERKDERVPWSRAAREAWPQVVLIGAPGQVEREGRGLSAQVERELGGILIAIGGDVHAGSGLTRTTGD